MDYINEWETSYKHGGNFIYYPKEEVVKFFNQFVRKRTGVDSFRDIIGSDLKGLDLGCGIGRQTILFEEFNITGYGLDISKTAISQARKLAAHFGYSPYFQVLQENRISFRDNFFNIAICDSVLDSMPFATAQIYMRELDRTVKHLLYISLFAGEGEEIKIAEHEKGTVQSYFRPLKICALLGGTNWRIKQIYQIVRAEKVVQSEKLRYHIVLCK